MNLTSENSVLKETKENLDKNAEMERIKRENTDYMKDLLENCLIPEELEDFTGV